MYWAELGLKHLKQLVLLRALEAKGRATTNTPLAHFLCRICPTPLFREILAAL